MDALQVELSGSFTRVLLHIFQNRYVDFEVEFLFLPYHVSFLSLSMAPARVAIWRNVVCVF